MTEKW